MELLESPQQLHEYIPDTEHVLSNEDVRLVEKLKKQGALQKVNPETFCGVHHAVLCRCKDGYHALDKEQYFARIFLTANGRAPDLSDSATLGGALVFAPESDMRHYVTREELTEIRKVVHVELRAMRYLKRAHRCQLIIATAHRICAYAQSDMCELSLFDSQHLLAAARKNLEEIMQVPARAFSHFCSKRYIKRRKFYELVPELL